MPLDYPIKMLAVKTNKDFQNARTPIGCFSFFLKLILLLIGYHDQHAPQVTHQKQCICTKDGHPIGEGHNRKKRQVDDRAAKNNEGYSCADLTVMGKLFSKINLNLCNLNM